MSNVEVNITHEGGSASYSVLEDGTIHGDFNLKQGFELVIGATPEGNYYQRINDISNPEADPEQTVFELPSGRIFDSEKGVVRLPNGNIASLSPLESHVLRMLSKSPLVTIRDYANEFNMDEKKAASFFKTYVKRIRKKIDVDDSSSIIVNFRGYGYGIPDK